jgi:hypothetical protein
MIRQHKRTLQNDDESEPLRTTIARVTESWTLLLSQCMPLERAPTQRHHVQRSTASESVCSHLHDTRSETIGATIMHARGRLPALGAGNGSHSQRRQWGGRIPARPESGWHRIINLRFHTGIPNTKLLLHLCGVSRIRPCRCGHASSRGDAFGERVLLGLR